MQNKCRIQVYPRQNIFENDSKIDLLYSMKKRIIIRAETIFKYKKR